ncbi:MAG: alpha/beta hydrolase [Desulfobacteraceae bacterium]
MIQQQINGVGFVAGNWPLVPDRPTVVFIHGAAMNHDIWTFQVTALAGLVNTVALDLPGRNLSDGPGKDNIPDMASFVSRFLDILKPCEPILCGISMGGAIVQYLLMHGSKRVTAGILINTGAKLKVMPLIFETIKKNYNHFVESLSLFAISRKSDAEHLQPFIRTACDCDPETALMDFAACNEFDAMDQAHQISTPTLIISARDDMITPAKYSRFLATHIQAATHIDIEKAGHFSPLEKPEKINTAILNFINKTIPS